MFKYYYAGSNGAIVIPLIHKVVKGDNCVFKCLQGGPVSWTFNGKKMPLNVQYLYNSKLLILENIQQNNAGNYICHELNAKGERVISKGVVKVTGISKTIQICFNSLQ